MPARINHEDEILRNYHEKNAQCSDKWVTGQIVDVTAAFIILFSYHFMLVLNLSSTNRSP